MFFSESFDYVYVDDKTFIRQLSYIKEGFVSIVLLIDPTKKNIATNYTAPGRIIQEGVIGKETPVSTELIKLILDITKRNLREKGERWYPKYKIYIKYKDRFLFIIPVEKHLGVIFDFKNSILFIEGRKFVFTEQEAKALQVKLGFLLNMPQ